MKIIPSLVYYITAHGYGHGVRSCDIIRALRKAAPDLFIHVVSDLPVDFLRSRLDLPLEAYRAGSFDVGMVQLDSIRVDVDQTLGRVEAVLAQRQELISREKHFLQKCNARVVVCDIPGIPIEAASAAGIPALAVGNFAWDWIYEEFIPRNDRWQSVVQAFRDAYARVDLLFKLPFSEPMAAFPKQFDIPLVSTPGIDRRAEMASALGIDPALKWVLLSFSTLEWDEDALRRVQELRDAVFLTVLPLGWPGWNLVAVDRHQFSFSDVIATADVVVSKPGYGILSECVINDKPLVYAERTDFREYPILEAALKLHLRHQHIPANELYRGNVKPYLEAIAQSPPPLAPLAAGGDTIAAKELLKLGAF
ncbi:MAG TPA: hypothetical protein PJ991_08560 [Kiritimatiellia bacterium]|nr:hypothetical protein [Kiritimatiellia bacterium]